MKIRYLKLKNWLLVSVMGALGFTSCHSSKKAVAPEPEIDGVQIRDEPMRLMYGVPTMHFRVQGQVTDTKGKPVRDIRVNLLEGNMDVEGNRLVGDADAVQKWLDGTEVRTDKNGHFEVQGNDRPQQEVRLLVRDVDGKANGEFHDKVVTMPVSEADMDRSNAGGWDQGTFHKEVKVKLEKK